MSKNKEDTDWDLEDFQRAKLVGTTEVLLSAKGDDLLIFTPWFEYFNQDAMDFASTLGFTSITEVGNIQNYSIPEVACDDWDFVRVAPIEVFLEDPRAT